MTEHPIAVIGAGPVGLAAAAHLIQRGLPVRLYEAGDHIGASVREWGHVRLFSPWKFNVDQAARTILRDEGWQEPAESDLPTGHALVETYLEPLANTRALRDVIRLNSRVQNISRRGIDKVVTRDRAKVPFSLTVANGNGKPRVDLASAVIDASGTWQTPNPLGSSGHLAPGESEAAARIFYGIPDVLRRDRAQFASARILVVGGGHSAANVLLDLAGLAETDDDLRVTWALRAKNFSRVFGGEAKDQLQARGELGSRLRALVESGRIDVVLGFGAEEVSTTEDGVNVTGSTSDGSRVVGPFDRIIVATGQRPDLQLTRELRLDLDPWLESPRALGPMIDPNLHSCGSVPPHGHRELAHPEADYFAVGVKSYGRAPTFLMATGYEQVRSITAKLAGDMASADDVRLVLPETGVCSISIAAENVNECCGGPPTANKDACCAEDEVAKAAGEGGCGCNAEPAPSSLLAKAACCGAPTHV